MKTTTVKATLPKLVVVRDYHEFDSVKETLNDILDVRVKVKEIAFDGDYIGVVYVDKLPTKQEIDKLLKKAKLQVIEVY